MDVKNDGGSVRISVIVPALNEEAYLPACLESLERQSFQGPFEIIIVDNNSVDRTAEVALKMGAKVVFEPHVGITWARQKGLEATRGEVVAFMDADSRAGRDWLERVAAALERNPQAVAVSGNVIYDRGRGFRGNLPHWFGPTIFFIDRGLRWLFRKQGSLWGANFAVRKDALLRAGGFNKAFHFHAEDAELSIRLRRLGPILFDKASLVRTSPRRYEQKGVARTLWNQFSAFVRMVTFGRERSAGTWTRLRLSSRVSVTLLLILSILGLTSGAVYLGVSPSSQLYGRVYAGAPRGGEKVIALTFDDGPNEPYTSRVLAILNESEVKATFFLVGENAELYPETVKNIVRAGHVIGNHTYHHTYLLPFEGFAPIRKEIDGTEETLFRLTGLRTDLFRPPHGLRTPWLIAEVKELNYKVITWTDMTNDYNGNTSAGEIARRIAAKARPGGIIVLHDGRDTQHGVDRSNTVDALPVIIRRLKSEGYRFVTVPALLHVAPYK